MKLKVKLTSAELKTFGTYFFTAFRCALDLELFSAHNYFTYYNLRSLQKKLIDRTFSETHKHTLKLCVNEYEALKWLRDCTSNRISLDTYHAAITRGIFDVLHQQELKISHRTNFLKFVS